MKTDIQKFFNEDGLKNKKNAKEADISKGIGHIFQNFIDKPSKLSLLHLIEHMKLVVKMRLLRPSLYYGMISSLKEANADGVSNYEAVKNQRNRLRKIGRSVDGKVLATTLLTKGLEFDTVAILDAHKFSCPKHLYVAISRCCKKLVVFSEQSTIELSTLN